MLSGLEVVAAVVEAKSFVRAGAAIGLTQSGVSRAVARLEAELGLRLFDRNARAVTLTEEGRRFYAEVAPRLAALEEAVEQATVGAAAVRGRLRVNVHAYIARNVLAPRLGEFLAAYPALDVELVVRDDLGNLVADGFDAAVRFGDPPPSALVARRLLRTRILTCASPAYLAAHGRPRTPRDLVSHECLRFIDPATGRPFPWEFRRQRRVQTVRVFGRIVVNDVATAENLCLAGAGVAQLMDLGARELVASGQLVALFPDWQDELFPLYAFHLSRERPPAKVRAFVDFLVALARSSDVVDRA